MADEVGSSFLFNADAQSVLEQAPNLESGLSQLHEFYGANQWDDPDAAAKTASDYAQQLRYRFKDKSQYDNSEIGQIAPVHFNEVTADGDTESQRNVNHVNAWEKANKDFLATTTDPDYVVIKDKLTNSIDKAASDLRRQARTEGRTDFGNVVSNTFYRVADAATGNIADLVGAKDYRKALRERTDPSFDDDLATTIATTAGFVGATVATGAIATTAEAAYLLANAAGAVKDRYQESIADTGDVTKAREGAAIEGGAQALGIYGAGKVLGPAGKAIGARIFGRETAEVAPGALSSIIKAGATQGAVGAGQALGSNEARIVGSDLPQKDAFKGVVQSAAVGAVFGAGADALRITLSPVQADPIVENGGVIPPQESTAVGSIPNSKGTEKIQAVGQADPQNYSFVTKDGSLYAATDEGSTKRVKVSTQEEFHPLDKTFFVKKEVAGTLAALRDTTTPDGKPIQILTDGNNLLIKSEYINPDLTVNDTPTGSRIIPVPIEEGAAVGNHPVEVNRPKNVNGNNRVYQSHIGQEITQVNEAVTPKSGGAAFTEESAVGQRLRTTESLHPDIRALFGDEEAGYLRYFPVTHVDLKNEAGTVIAQTGIEQATSDFLNRQEGIADPAVPAEAAQLSQFYVKAAEQARATGDVEGFEKLSIIAADIFGKAQRLGTTTAQTLDAMKILKASLTPEMHTAAIRGKLSESAVNEVAAEEGVTPRDIHDLPKQVQAVDEQIEAINQEAQKNSGIVEASFDKDIQDSTKLAGEIDKEAQNRFTEHTTNEKSLIERAQNEADTIEQEAQSRSEKDFAELDKQTTKAQGRVKELESQATKQKDKEDTSFSQMETAKKRLEEKGLKRAEAEKEKAIKAAESAVKKTKENKGKGAKGSEEVAARQEENLKTLKEKKVTLEDGLTPEEKAVLKKLSRNLEKKPERKTPEDTLSASERKELDKLKETLEKVKTKKETKKAEVLAPKEKVKLDKLNNFIKEKKTSLAGLKKEDFLKPSELKQKTNLIKKRDELRNKKAEAQKRQQSYLSDAQKQRLKDLTSTKERLTKRQEKVTAKKEEKQKEFTIEKQQKLEKLTKLLPKLVEGSDEAKKVTTAIAEIKGEAASKITDPTAKDWIYSYWLSNILSNPATHTTNVAANLINLATTPLSYTITGKPGAAIEFIKGAFSGLGRAGQEAGAILKGEGRSRAGDSKINEARKGDLDIVKEGGILGKVGYSLRLLSAEDQVFFTTAKEGQARAIAYMGGVKEGLRGKKLQEYITDKLYNSKQNFSEAKIEAKQNAEALRSAGIEITPRAETLMAWDILDAKRDTDIKNESTRFGYQATFNNNPEGVLGSFYKVLNDFRNASIPIPGTNTLVKPMRYLFPFLKTPLNVANAYIGFDPVLGLPRAYTSIVHGKELVGVGKTVIDEETGATGTRPIYRQQSSLERSATIGKYALGALGTGLIGSLAYIYKDDRDPYVSVSGSGPEDADKRSQLRSQGWKPYTLKVGDKYVSYKETPLVFALGALGSLMDHVKYSKNYDSKSFSDKAGVAMSGALASFSDNSFLKTMADLQDSIFNPESGKNLVDVLAVNPIKGGVPVEGFLKFISNAIDNPIDTRGDFMAKMIQGIPFAQSELGKPTLNVFGEPVGRTWEDRIQTVGRYFNERTGDPDFRWLAENDYKVTDADNSTVKLDTTKYPSIATRREEELGKAFVGMLTPDEHREFIERVGPKIREIVGKYRQEYDTSGYQKSVQDDMSKEIARARSSTKKEMFLR